MLPCRGTFAEIDESGYGDEQLLSVTIAAGVIRQEELLRNSSKRDSSRLDRSSYKLVHPGDLVYNKMRAWQGAAGVSLHRGIVSPAYVVQRPRPSSEPRYFHYLFRTPAFATEAERWSYGIASDMWSLRPEHFKKIRCCLPPIEEQRAIVRFLDQMDRRVRRYVRAKERLIELLDEEKQAVINQAVTRGLDSSVRMKASGVEWLGDVPEHWEVVTLGRVGMFSKGGGGTKEDEVNVGLPCIRYGDIYMNHEYHIDNSRSCISPERSSLYTPIQYGDILFTGSGETIEEIGKSAANLLTGEAYCGGDVILFRPGIETNARFMGYAADCFQSAYQKSCMGRGITIMHIYSAQLKYMCLALPSILEQAAIAEHLDKAITDIETKIAHARRQIELVEEFRTRLIADVVTGKLDVREAGTESPDATEAPHGLPEFDRIGRSHEPNDHEVELA
ncbi:MAG: restriction endonuclease subunit S [Chloroflexota bacterium]|nr:restriction endonuclease subunit S [Chloroflexota bacterium]